MTLHKTASVRNSDTERQLRSRAEKELNDAGNKKYGPWKVHDSKWIGDESMSMLLTPAKKIIRENVQGIKEAATLADAISAFHACGCTSAVGVPNGKTGDSFVITCSGVSQVDFQRVQHEINAALKERGFSLVSVQYHEDPATHATTHTCFVKATVHI
jgi:hypothetical protein